MRASRRRIIFPIIAALAAVWILTKLSQPLVELRRVKLEVQPLLAENRRLDVENAALGRSLAELNTPRGLEAEAHRQGWIQPGERRLIFAEPQAPPEEPVVTPTQKPAPLFKKMQEWARVRGETFAKK